MLGSVSTRTTLGLTLLPCSVSFIRKWLRPNTTGVSSSVVMPMSRPCGGVSLSMTVPTPVPSATVALTGADSEMLKFSLASVRPSSAMLMVMVREVTPGVKLKVPEPAV